MYVRHTASNTARRLPHEPHSASLPSPFQSPRGFCPKPDLQIPRFNRLTQLLRSLQAKDRTGSQSQSPMADGLSLAASVAGLVSLGLQVTQGIVSYVDALESRQQELRSVQQQNDALSSALAVIESASAQLQGQHQHAAAAVSQNLLACTEHLEAVKKLLAELAHCDTSTWWKRVKNQKKKLSYAFDRPKLQGLAQRLEDANCALQLALAGLGLSVPPFIPSWP